MSNFGKLLTCYPIVESLLGMLSAYDAAKLAETAGIQLTERQKLVYLPLWKDIFTSKIWFNDVAAQGKSVLCMGKSLGKLTHRIEHPVCSSTNDKWHTIAFFVGSDERSTSIEKELNLDTFWPNLRGKWRYDIVGIALVIYLYESKIKICLREMNFQTWNTVVSSHKTREWISVNDFPMTERIIWPLFNQTSTTWVLTKLQGIPERITGSSYTKSHDSDDTVYLSFDIVSTVISRTNFIITISAPLY